MIGASRRTYKDLVDEVLRWAGMSSDMANLRTLAKHAVANAHQQRVMNGRWSFMLYPSPQTLSVVAGQQNYSLHEAFSTPQYFRVRGANARRIVSIPHTRVMDYLPDDTSASGTPSYVTLDGVSKVLNQPSSASVIAVAGSDTARSVTVIGETATGIESETITVGNSGSVEFLSVLDVTKSAGTWAGTVTLTANSGAVTILALSAAQYGRQFRQLRSLTTPTQAETWEYNFYRQPKQLVEDNDIPDIPYPFDDLLVIDARLAMQDVTRPTASAIRELERQQAVLEQDLIATFQDGLAEGSEPEYVTVVDRG